MADIPSERFYKGDIVYWCDGTEGKYKVKFGMVNEQWHDGYVWIDFLFPKERRLVNGIPIDDFKSEDRYKKLPKGWSYDTRLYEITYETLSEEDKQAVCDIRDPKSIKALYDKGYLVKDETLFWGEIRAEITANGYRIRKAYPMWEHHIENITLHWLKIRRTYEEAQAEVDAKMAEFYRQASLSEYDWSLEQIDKVLNEWKHYNDASDEEVRTYRDEFLKMDKLEEVEARTYAKAVQWKRIDNKKWNTMIF